MVGNYSLKKQWFLLKALFLFCKWDGAYFLNNFLGKILRLEYDHYFPGLFLFDCKTKQKNIKKDGQSLKFCFRVSLHSTLKSNCLLGDKPGRRSLASPVKKKKMVDNESGVDFVSKNFGFEKLRF